MADSAATVPSFLDALAPAGSTPEGVPPAKESTALELAQAEAGLKQARPWSLSLRQLRI